jgi:hypothetical protein|tara:strand:- start:16029 stop:16448 length:420 start_codon:yes stop_codon:yes gene_type:complete
MKAIVYVEGKSSAPFLVSGDGNVSSVDSTQMDSLPNAVFEEVELVDVIEFSENPNIVDIAVKKLRHGGVLKITGTDALQVIRNAACGVCAIPEASENLLNGRNNLTSAHDLKNRLASSGLEISSVGIIGYRYVVEAVRK